MKTIFFSDLHGKIELIDQLIKKEKPDRLYACGDLEINKDELEKYNIISVRGNCDLLTLPTELIIELDDKKILLVHGHTLNVKISLNNLLYTGLSKEVDVVFFGHTHNRYYYQDEKITLINPGSIRDEKSYVVYNDGEFITKRL